MSKNQTGKPAENFFPDADEMNFFEVGFPDLPP